MRRRLLWVKIALAMIRKFYFEPILYETNPEFVFIYLCPININTQTPFVRYNRFEEIMLKKLLFLIWLSLISFSLVPGQPAHAQTGASQILILTADGPVTPAMAQYLSRGIKIAERQGAQALIFQLNTPGGGIDAMNMMEQMILASTVPVIVYVSPSGAMAASAGTIITLAGHASAMAPNTTIGAASPGGSQGENLPTTEELKVKSATAATARSLT